MELSILITLIFFSNLIFSQIEIDENFTISIPVNQGEQITDSSNQYQIRLISENGFDKYEITRMNLNSIIDTEQFIKSKYELKRYYKNMSLDFCTNLQEENCYCYYQEIVDFKGLTCFKIKTSDIKNDTNYRNLELFIIQTNNYLYLFSYSNIVDFNRKNKNTFFNSIIVKNKNCQNSFKHISKYEIGRYIGVGLGVLLFPIIPIGIIILLILRKKKVQKKNNSTLLDI